MKNTRIKSITVRWLRLLTLLLGVLANSAQAHETNVEFLNIPMSEPQSTEIWMVEGMPATEIEVQTGPVTFHNVTLLISNADLCDHHHVLNNSCLYRSGRYNVTIERVSDPGNEVANQE